MLAEKPAPEPAPESAKKSPGFLDRTISNLKRAWKGIAGTGYDASTASSRPDLPEDDLEKLREQMRDCLEIKGGEVSARSRAAALGHVYLALDSSGKERFLRVLANDFDIDPGPVDAAADVEARARPCAGEVGSSRKKAIRPRCVSPRRPRPRSGPRIR